MTTTRTQVRAGLYVRVSTIDQDPHVQTHELRAYAARRGWTIADEYVDHGFSGSKTARPALDRLMADARRGKLDLVVVWALDRFGRSLSGLITSIDELTSLRVAFVSATQGIDTSADNPAATLTLNVLGAVAAFERSMIVARVRAGLAKAKAHGRRLGRPPAEIDLAYLRGRLANGESIRGVARSLGVSDATLRRALARAASETTPANDPK